jgi:antitoxin (DNA-binding transcriptional repressor) of toxin-antitoxin stability system
MLFMAVIHISEAEAANDFSGLMAQVRLGTEVVIESGTKAVAIVRPAIRPRPGRLLSELIAAAKVRDSSAGLDGSFAQNLEEVINGHSEPLNPPAWE